MTKPGSMPAPGDKQLTVPQKAAAKIMVWLTSGVLSGAVTACLVTTADWLLLGGAPAPVVIRHISGESYDLVKLTLTPIQHCLFLARFLVHDALWGAILGLLGGAFPALISSLYWNRIGGLKQTAIISGFFGILLAGWSLLASAVLEGAILGLIGGALPALIGSLYWNRIGRLKQAAIISGIFEILLAGWSLLESDVLDFREVTGFGATGAVFGVLVGLFARLLCILLEARERARHEGRAVLAGGENHAMRKRHCLRAP